MALTGARGPAAAAAAVLAVLTIAATLSPPAHGAAPSEHAPRSELEVCFDDCVSRTSSCSTGCPAQNLQAPLCYLHCVSDNLRCTGTCLGVHLGSVKARTADHHGHHGAAA